MMAMGTAGHEVRPGPTLDWPALHRAACAPYRAAGRFAWHFARGKLGRDPVFRYLATHGLLEPRRHDGASPIRLLDIGCGQGLLASLVAALDAGAGSALPAPPRGRWRYSGIDLMPRDVERARTALASLDPPPRFDCADMRDAAFAPCDVAVVLDVMHYVDLAAQRRVLERLHAALAPGGRLLLRVGDMAGEGFAASQWVDRAVTRVRGHAAPPVWGRPLADWLALLGDIGWPEIEPVPMSHGTPFANVLLIAEKSASADAPPSGASATP